MATHGVALAGDEQPHDLAEEAGEQRVERTLRLQERVHLVQQALLRRQLVIDLTHVRRQQLTRCVRVPVIKNRLRCEKFNETPDIQWMAIIGLSVLLPIDPCNHFSPEQF